MYARALPRLLCFLMAAGILQAAEVPNLISYQGQLTNAAGQPVVTLTTVRFVLLRGGDATSNPSAGVPVYREDAVIAPDASGVFSHLIGAGTPSGLCDENADGQATEPCTLGSNDFPDGATPLFLEVRIDPAGADNVLLPRQKMASVAYAMRAANVNGLSVGNQSGQIPIGNGQLNQNLNADMVDGYNAGNASGQVAVNNGNINANLNADLLDGLHANEIIDAAGQLVCADITLQFGVISATSCISATPKSFSCPAGSVLLAAKLTDNTGNVLPLEADCTTFDTVSVTTRCRNSASTCNASSCDTSGTNNCSIDRVILTCCR